MLTQDQQDMLRDYAQLLLQKATETGAGFILIVGNPGSAAMGVSSNFEAEDCKELLQTALDSWEQVIDEGIISKLGQA